MASHVVKTGFFERKSLNYRGFLEKRDAQDLQDFVQRMFHLQFLANDGHQHIDANRNPDLRLHGVRRSSIKRGNSGISGGRCAERRLSMIRHRAKKPVNLEVASEACMQAFGTNPSRERLEDKPLETPQFSAGF